MSPEKTTNAEKGPRDLDGRVAQGWGGDAPNGVHVNLILARRGSATAAAMTSAFASPSVGFTPILACAGANQRSYETIQPITILLPKTAPANEFGQTLISGAVQVGTGQAVLDAVADRLIAGDQEHLIFVSVWVDPAADDERSVRDSAREAVDAALREALGGRDPAQVAAMVNGRVRLTHPFYGGR